MTEAVQTIEDFAMKELHANRIEIRAATKNKPSQKIPEKLGYTFEGTLKNEDKNAAGDLLDICVYAKVTES